MTSRRGPRPRVRVLPDHVANQIAAGEVVERPASVVKELVENAVDAHADTVRVTLEGGGKTRIAVADDGWGMTREDVLASLDRHATSKIRHAEDLHEIRTLGFRGEALPSIAAVSRMTLESAVAEEDSGVRVRVLGGKIQGVEETARRPGATVDVRNLFFNTPVRARFLKSASVEARAASDVLHTLALANLGVRFVLETGGRRTLDLAGGRSVVGRVGEIWKDAREMGLIPLGGRRGDLSVEGAIQRPDLARRGFRRLQLFVNGRPFRDAGLVAAADAGYRTTIPEGAKPWLFLFLGVAPGLVDVNVHPGKAEVRFRNRAAVESFVETTVRRTLQGAESAAAFGAPSSAGSVRERPGGRTGGAGRSGAAPPEALSGDAGRPGPSRLGGPAAGRAPSGPPPPGGPSLSGDPPLPASPSGASPADAPGDVAAPSSAVSPSASPPAAGRLRAVSVAPTGGQMILFPGTGQGGGPPGAERVPGEDALVGEAPRPPLVQIHNSFILAETRDGLIFVDQHAAHERILYERIAAEFESGDGEGQRLLFPFTIRLTRQELDVMESVSDLLAGLGFELAPFGPDALLVQSVPNPHRYFDAESCIREMIHELAHGSDLMKAARNQNDRVAMSFACKGAIKAGQKLEPEEMQDIFDQLFATKLPYHDVHGRPTVVRLGIGELERKFGRT